MVKNPPAKQETRVQSWDREDPLEEDIATHYSILALKNPIDRGAWWATVHRVTEELDTTQQLNNNQKYSEKRREVGVEEGSSWFLMHVSLLCKSHQLTH